jgi:DnaJ-class molecular chaperone
MSDAHDRKRPAAGRAGKAPSSSGDRDDEAASTAEESHDRSEIGQRPCMPCHGTGKVISNLGGHATKITCPWCRGGGERLTGADAQEFQREQAALKRR